MSYNNQIKFFLSIILGTNIGILLQQVVFKTLPLGIGWTLLSTSPVISLLFAEKEEEENKIKYKIINWSLIFWIMHNNFAKKIVCKKYSCLDKFKQIKLKIKA